MMGIQNQEYGNKFIITQWCTPPNVNKESENDNTIKTAKALSIYNKPAGVQKITGLKHACICS